MLQRMYLETQGFLASPAKAVGDLRRAVSKNAPGNPFPGWRKSSCSILNAQLVLAGPALPKFAPKLGGRFGYFLCFLPGGGEGGGVLRRRDGGGLVFNSKSQEGGGSPRTGGGVGRRAGRVCLRGSGGGLFFFRGHLKHPILGPPEKKVDVPHFLEKDAKISKGRT